MSNESLLLHHQQITPIIKRMALQIVENNLEEKHLIVAGIKDRGVDIANMLMKEMTGLFTNKITFVEISINKENPLEVDVPNAEQYKNLPILLVDDVADSGKTMMYAIKPFLKNMVKKIEIAVLIDREHKRFPIISNYIGYQVSTTVKEKISVEVNKDKVTAYIA